MRLLWSSDHHTLHSTTPTEHILGNLTTFLLKDHDLAQVQMVVFGGDFTETIVEAPNKQFIKIMDWNRMFLDRCMRINPDIIVIWLAGTESHDRGQPRHFLNCAPIGLDVRYIDTLCIQTFKHLDDLTVMYVPDNMGSLSPEAIWELALKTLKAHNLDKVDLIFFHGGFEQQLHINARHKAHVLALWESITVYGILAGHIHKPIKDGKLMTSGSFDRTAHGEEHPKGGLVVELDKSKEYYNPVFWENKNALPYLSIKVDPDINAEDLIRQVHTFIKGKQLPPHSQLRIVGGPIAIVDPVLRVLQSEYPQFGFKEDSKLSKDILIDEALYEASQVMDVTLTAENLYDSLLDEVESEFGHLGIEMDYAKGILEEFL